jgi:hypothetical protein
MNCFENPGVNSRRGAFGGSALPVVPGFQYDLFISYAHLNDEPFKEGGVGWVTDFIRSLRKELEAQDRSFSMWFDPSLRTGEDFNLAIRKAISGSAVFLSILSPAYENSPYCKKEIAEFRARHHPAFGMVVGTFSRIQAVVLERLSIDLWPPELRTTAPFYFYSETAVRFNKPSEADETKPYVQGLWKTRDSIFDTLKEMRRLKEQGTVVENSYPGQTTPEDPAPAAYLADVSDDLFNKRENLIDALRQVRGFRVEKLSEHTMPLGPWNISIHMFGKYPGAPAPGKQVHSSRLQLEAALGASPARRPLVWLARDLQPEAAETEPHRQFLTSLMDHAGIEILRMSFEDLKDEIQKRVVPRASPLAKTVRRPYGDPIVHIWHRDCKPEPLAPLKQRLIKNHCGIAVFPYSRDRQQELQSKLAFCDGLMLSYTEESKSWAEDVMAEAFQMRRREERPLAFAAVGLPPLSQGEFNFEHPRVVPIRGTSTGEFPGMDHFLAKLEEQNVQ